LDKVVLEQYIDACKLIKETEEEIRKIKRRRETIVQGTVKGSLPDFPYTEKRFHVSGLSYSVVSSQRELEEEEKILEKRKQNAAMIKRQVEEWLNTIPVRIQRIIQKRFFEQKSWNEVAMSMGRKATADGVIMEFERFMSEKGV